MIPPLLDRADQLGQLATRIRGAPRFALDTEAASFHRYVDRVYLVQISTDRETALIDPLAVDDLSPLGGALADPELEVVFHDADYDLRILDRDYGFRARHVFDTRIAAQLAGEPAIGLGSLLEKHFGVKLNKKYQRADWSMRPLPEEMLAYAAADTSHLLELRDLLDRQLVSLGRADWAREEFRRLEAVRWTRPAPSEEGAFLRIKGAKALRGRALAILQALHAWRDSLARERDLAPFRIIGNQALLSIARAQPLDIRQLQELPEVPDKLARRYGQDLLRVVSDGLAVPREQWPVVERPRRPPPDPAFDARLDRLKTLRNRRAEEAGLDPGLVCPNGTLAAIAGANPQNAAELENIEELRNWQRELLTEGQILRAVEG